MAAATTDALPAKKSGVKTRVVKLRRAGGRVVQSCDVYIGRACSRGGWSLAKSKWANPFAIAQCGGSAARAVQEYEKWLRGQPELLACVGELRGKVLGCWCKTKSTQPCHGDVLARLADESLE